MLPNAEVPTLLHRRSWRFKLWSQLLGIAQALASRSIRGRNRIRQLAKHLIGDRYIEVPYLGNGSMWVCPNHTMGEDLFRRGVYEPQVIKAIQTFISHGFSFVDVGANIGLHTVAAGLCQGSNQRFFAFEPEPRAFFLLKKNCELNNLMFVEAMHTAVGREEGIANLYISTTHNQGHHSLIQHSENVRVSTCSVTSLDRLFFSGPPVLKGPVLLKIDVEGAEPAVLAGGLTWLRQVENLVVICEISNILLRRSGHSPSDVIDLLKQIGCDHYFLTEDNSSDPWLNVGAESLINNLGDKWMNLLATKGSEAFQISQGLIA